MTGASTTATGEGQAGLVAFIACITRAVAIRAPVAAQQLVLRDHGWALARIALLTHMPEVPSPMGQAPDPALLRPSGVLL